MATGRRWIMLANTNDFVRQMGLTHREFFRTLPAAVGSHSFTVAGNVINVALDTGYIVITLAEESVRRIASIKIAQTDVHFVFKDVSTNDRFRFMEYFDRKYQRGGG